MSVSSLKKCLYQKYLNQSNGQAGNDQFIVPDNYYLLILSNNNSNKSDGIQLLKSLLLQTCLLKNLDLKLLLYLITESEFIAHNKLQISILQESIIIYFGRYLDNEFKEMTDNTLMGLNAICFCLLSLHNLCSLEKSAKSFSFQVMLISASIKFNQLRLNVNYANCILALQNIFAWQKVKNHIYKLQDCLRQCGNFVSKDYPNVDLSMLLCFQFSWEKQSQFRTFCYQCSAKPAPYSTIQFLIQCVPTEFEDPGYKDLARKYLFR
ncbi:unnamed protein product [Paramecium octaurelia]|uniref:Uncharacterized protein n=1 Tax=Paramecium octaurelia TaxID=43137 RepID=A0A8S1XML0_PAROT|nr:unnamed protein product [Paramecium octaurelia]